MKTKYLYGISILYILPALLLFCVFLLSPIVQAIIQSFYSWKGIAGIPMKFVGLKNYSSLIFDEKFWYAMFNSFLFMVGAFLVLMPLAFLLAVIITSNIKGTRFYKTAFFMPVMLPITAVGLMWVYILEPNWGLLNSLLVKIELSHLAANWLGTPFLNVVSVVLVNEWIFAGLNMLIFAAGLVAIPEELYEAATIDGAKKIQQLLHITLPQMKNSFQVFSVIAITGCLKTFDLIYAMTQGGPNRTSEVPATLLYNEAFVYKNFGKGNAIGTIILLIGLFLSVLISKFIQKDSFATRKGV